MDLYDRLYEMGWHRRLAAARAAPTGELERALERAEAAPRNLGTDQLRDELRLEAGRRRAATRRA